MFLVILCWDSHKIGTFPSLYELLTQKAQLATHKASHTFSVDMASLDLQIPNERDFCQFPFFTGAHHLSLPLVSVCCIVGPPKQQNATLLFLFSEAPNHLEYVGH